MTSTDPLADSDEELMDEYVRTDYSESLELIPRARLLMTIADQRIAVLTRLRGKAPTPPPDLAQTVTDSREHRWRTVQSWK